MMKKKRVKIRKCTPLHYFHLLMHCIHRILCCSLHYAAIRTPLFHSFFTGRRPSLAFCSPTTIAHFLHRSSSHGYHRLLARVGRSFCTHTHMPRRALFALAVNRCYPARSRIHHLSPSFISHLP